MKKHLQARLDQINAHRSGVAAGAGTGLLFLSQSSNAALNAGVADGFTALTTDFNSLLTLAYPVMITIVVALVIFGMVKGFIHKAAGK